MEIDVSAPARQPAICPEHGIASKTRNCAGCNSAYMRAYLRRRRVEDPQAELLSRARERATRRKLDFNINRSDVMVPATCPALGISIVVGKKRSNNSPSLDRILPHLGYVKGNVRVISDRANRLKGLRGASELRLLAKTSDPAMAKDYAKVADYVDRETLLAEVRRKAESGGNAGLEWEKIAKFMEKIFGFMN